MTTAFTKVEMDDVARSAMGFRSAQFPTNAIPTLTLFKSKSESPLDVDPYRFAGPEHIIHFMRHSGYEWAVLVMVGDLAFGRPAASFGKFIADTKRMSLVVWLHGPGGYDKLFTRAIGDDLRLASDVNEWDPGTFCVLEDDAQYVDISDAKPGGRFAEA